jgi:hypothetical protein
MIGSDTFIIVAFRCSDRRSPCALASSIDVAKKACSARRLIIEAPTTSLASTLTSFNTLDDPSAPISSIRRTPLSGMTADCSFP